MHWLRYIPLGDAVIEKAWGRVAGTLALCLLFVAVPLFAGFDHTVVNVVEYVAVYAILALGLNVVVGYTGLLDLGYVTFLATGAILTYDLLLLTNTADQGLVLPVGTTEIVTGTHPFAFDGSILLIMLISGLVCAFIGVLRGIPTLKLTGDYYAIVTLGIAEIVFLIYLNSSELTGGAYGMKLSAATRPELFGVKLYWDSAVLYFLIGFLLLATIVVMDRLNRSRTGRAWAAIRLDEVAARASGIDISRSKMIAFAISGFVGGVGGSLYAVFTGTVATKGLDIWQSILILCAVVLGGMGSIRGVLVGSAILFSLREVLREKITPFQGSCLLAVLLVIVLLAFVPQVRAIQSRLKRYGVAGAAAVVVVLIGWLFGRDAEPIRVPPQASFLIYGLLLIFVMRFRPQGLLPRSTGESRPMSQEEEEALLASKPRLFVLSEEGSA